MDILFVVLEDFICCFRGSLLICIALELMGLSHALIKKEEFIDNFEGRADDFASKKIINMTKTIHLKELRPKQSTLST